MARSIEFAQADMTDQETLKACGMKLKGNKLVSDDAEEVEFGELSDGELQRHNQRQAGTLQE